MLRVRNKEVFFFLRIRKNTVEISSKYNEREVLGILNPHKTYWWLRATCLTKFVLGDSGREPGAFKKEEDCLVTQMIWSYGEPWAPKSWRYAAHRNSVIMNILRKSFNLNDHYPYRQAERNVSCLKSKIK